MQYVFDPPQVPFATVADSDAVFPVRRIFCIGRNYFEHVREMGFEPAREEPFYFTKPADALVRSGSTLAFQQASANVHHEVELVVAIGREGRNLNVERALDHVFGYAVGNDLTRRDLQIAARERGRPWDFSKAFDDSAHIGVLHPAETVSHPARARIWLTINQALRQDSNIAEMVWSTPELIAHLSKFQTLMPGDLIFTGTPAGVGLVSPGDMIDAGIDHLGTLSTRFAAVSAEGDGA
jgi:fumarylpyruvate hydrolase